MSWTPERIAKERKFIEEQKRRARGKFPRWERERRVPEYVEEQRRLEFFEELKEAVEEAEEDYIPKYKPSVEEIEEFVDAMQEHRYNVRKTYDDPTKTRIIRNDDKTVCWQRPMILHVTDPETGATEETERMSPETCKRISALEMSCIEKKKDEEPCEQVKQAYACANYLTATEVSGAVDTPKSQTDKCMRQLRSQRYINPTNNFILGERRFEMPHDKARKIRE